ncbi:PQQ-like beta-propeller repeat protein [Sedimentimonas flavescens]|uniref:PQQ-like beta-propeller repeat protein n=1 Tax=Sedimentimonas flavescens TaxID=2851012 RepID=UPI001C4A73C6|nr:PQQ-like beta-propeller repeat protein [Sedimentimonas flavescens]MBW0157407.1 PQQ-binding-like beta-propeller repeat protein [Sedimentimonas flavescens]MCT2538678.1 PQQ-binding-like beta-propeller repeat protein [Sedimentimonas flavescens]
MKAVKLIRGMAVLGMAALVTGCEKELILEGDRIDPRDVLSQSAADAPLAISTAIALPAQQSNAEWTHRAGNPSHALVNPAIGGGTARVWSAAIGEGAGRKHRITADPVVGAGRIYTLDARAQVAATGLNGAALWKADLTPPSDNADDASGGGLAYADGQVYVTTGFGELVALDAASGAVKWRQKFDAAIGGAPTVSGGLVYVVARDASAWAIRATDGKVQWQLPGTPSGSAMVGVSAPAVNERMVVFPFSSGEMVGALKQGGLTLWQGKVAGARLGRAFATVTDLTGDPVIVGDKLYAGSSAGKVGAFDVNSGERIWTATEGAVSPVQVAGGSIFLVSDEARLVRLDAATGATIWAQDLPYFVKEKIKKQAKIFVHYGPLLAGNKLFVASTDGLLRSFDPATGALLGQTEIPGGAATNPVVAGGTLYVVGMNGQLHAFR